MVNLIPITSIQDLAQDPQAPTDKPADKRHQKISHYRGSIAIAQQLGCTHLWVSKYEFGQKPDLN